MPQKGIHNRRRMGVAGMRVDKHMCVSSLHLLHLLHPQGCLTFDGCSTVGERIAAEVSAADQRTIERCGFELWFVYANQLPFSALQVCLAGLD